MDFLCKSFYSSTMPGIVTSLSLGYDEFHRARRGSPAADQGQKFKIHARRASKEALRRDSFVYSMIFMARSEHDSVHVCFSRAKKVSAGNKIQGFFLSEYQPSLLRVTVTFLYG
jgi:hypothetical protein